MRVQQQSKACVAYVKLNKAGLGRLADLLELIDVWPVPGRRAVRRMTDQAIRIELHVLSVAKKAIEAGEGSFVIELPDRLGIKSQQEFLSSDFDVVRANEVASMRTRNYVGFHFFDDAVSV